MNVVSVRLVLARRCGEDPPVDEHVSAMASERRWAPVADVVIFPPTWRRGSEWSALTRLFADFPGCLVVACGRADGTCVVATREERIEGVIGPRPWAVASAAHAWTVYGGRLADLGATMIRTAGRGQGPWLPEAPAPAFLEVRRVR